MTDRRIVVEAAFGKTPYDTVLAGDWVTLARPDGLTRAKEAVWSTGRSDELDDFEVGTASLVLWDRDRALDPENTAGPYFGDLLPLVPVRIRSQDRVTLVWSDEFYGYVEGGWEQVLAPKGTGDRRLELVDLLGVVVGHTLPDVFDAAVLAQGPAGFWVLDSADGEQVADRAPGRHDGRLGGSGVSLGDRVITPGHPPAARFDIEIDPATDEDTFGHVYMGRSPVTTAAAGGVLVMVTFIARSKGSLNWRTLFVHGNGNGPATATGYQMHVDTDGRLVKVYSASGAGSAQRTDVSVVDGRPHIAFGFGTTVALDSYTATATSATSNALGTINGAGIGGGPGIQDVDHFDGWIGSVAVFDSAGAVGSAGRQAIYEAYSKLDGLRSDQQIGWALDQVGVPAGMRNLDAGTVTLGPAETRDRDALEWMRDVARTEGGGLYVDHRNGGVIRFTNRYTRFLAARSTASQATFSDDPNAFGAVRYPPEGLDIAPNGRDSIINQVTVVWAGGKIVVEDDVSIAAYGARARTVDTAATTAAQARSAGEWVIAQHATPRSRVKGVTASARTTSARDDDVQALRLDDRVTFRVHPLKVGAPTTVDVFVDGVTNRVSGVEWVTSFRFAPADTFVPWIWGTSAWGETTTWG